MHVQGTILKESSLSLTLLSFTGWISYSFSHPFLILVLRTFCGPDIRKNMNIKRKVELGGD